jgi:hypothetical protein
MCQLLAVSGAHAWQDDDSSDPVCVFLEETDTFIHLQDQPRVGQVVEFQEGPRQITRVGSTVWRDKPYHCVRF